MSHKQTVKPARFSRLCYAAAPLTWIAQAALLSHAVGLLQNGAGIEGVLMHAVWVAVLGLVRAYVECVSSRHMFKAARLMLRDWRYRVFSAFCERSPLDKTKPAAGLAANVVAEQGEALLPWVVRYQALMLRVAIVPPVMLVCIFYNSWLCALILLVAAPVIPMFWIIIGGSAKKAAEEQWVKMGEMNAFLLDRLRGLKTLRTLGAVDYTTREVRNNAESVRTRTMKVLRVAFLSSAVLELFSALGVAMLAVYIGFQLLGELSFGSWGGKLTLSQGLFMLMLAPTFFEPLREVAAIWHDRVSGKAAIEGFEALSQTQMRIVTPIDNVGARVETGNDRHGERLLPPEVAICDLEFAFPGGAPVFNRFSMNVESGEHVAILGDSGGGKTVLLSLLAGLVHADNGAIHIGGTSLTGESIGALRGQIGWMGQRPQIFSRSIYANITLNRPWIDREAVIAALKQARLYETVKDRLAEQLGEDGAGLSGGEIARLALARLAADKKAGLLLLDEPTAHLDRQTAQEVTEALFSIGEGRTMIVATHDPQLAARMDRIIYLDPAREMGAVA